MPGDSPENAACHAGNCRGRAYGWLKKRTEFLNVAKGSRAHSAAFVLQGASASGNRLAPPQPASTESCDDTATGRAGGPRVRFGLTVSKKNGNAVKRNRIKRRLRAALAEICQPGLCDLGVRDGYDYVIVARPGALDCGYDRLVGDLRKSLAKLHAGGGRRGSVDGKVKARSHTAPVS